MSSKSFKACTKCGELYSIDHFDKRYQNGEWKGENEAKMKKVSAYLNRTPDVEEIK